MARERSEPAILTMTGDNALTIGFMGAVLYVGALLLVQLWRHFMPGGENA